MSALVAKFMNDVTAIARDAARAELMARLRGEPAAAPTVSHASAPPARTVAAERPRVPMAAPMTTAAPPSAAARAVRPKGEKRPAHELGQIRARLRSFIAERPGLRSEQIYAAMGLTQRDIMLPLRKLVAEGEVRSEGEKRSTKYYPAGSSAAERSSPAPKAAVVRRRR